MLNEQRQYADFKLIGLNETDINGQPATRAQYENSGEETTLSYFMITPDYEGYMLQYEIDSPDFAKHIPEIERMVNSFKITK